MHDMHTQSTWKGPCSIPDCTEQENNPPAWTTSRPFKHWQSDSQRVRGNGGEDAGESARASDGGVGEGTCAGRLCGIGGDGRRDCGGRRGRDGCGGRVRVGMRVVITGGLYVLAVSF